MKVGIIGGGQLAQMLALAAYPLGIQSICLEKTADCPASLVAKIIEGDYNDADALSRLVAEVDIITYEFENIDLETLKQFAGSKNIYPPLKALEISRDRWQEKSFFKNFNIPTTQFFLIKTLGDLKTALDEINTPAVLKTCRMGYDGKGQFIIRDKSELENIWDQCTNPPYILENFINFDFEVSQIAVRNEKGEIKFYPLTKNKHQQGILAISEAPYSNQDLQCQAQNYVKNMLEKLQYVGTFTIEFFVKDNQLIANEIAPRVHNSGHWTIEGAQISQFENHMRAICGYPLGATESIANSVMFNLVGQLPDINKLLEIPEAHVHLYGKAPRKGRKLGHVTICMQDNSLLDERYKQLQEIIF